MFGLELARAWTLRIDRMARPERSGVIANLVVYGLLWSYGAYLIPHDYGDGFNVLCYLMPWECPKTPELTPEFSEQEIQRRYHVITLYDGVGRKKCCTCHLDLHYFGKPVMHFHSVQEPACDSGYTEPRTWTTIADYCSNKILGPNEQCSDALFQKYVKNGEYVAFRAKSGEAEWRFHCDTSTARRKPSGR